MKIWFINSFNDKYINYYEKLLMLFILLRIMKKNCMEDILMMG